MRDFYKNSSAVRRLTLKVVRKDNIVFGKAWAFMLCSEKVFAKKSGDILVPFLTGPWYGWLMGRLVDKIEVHKKHCRKCRNGSKL